MHRAATPLVRTLVASALVASVGLAACGDDEDDSAASDTTAAPDATEATAATSEPGGTGTDVAISSGPADGTATTPGDTSPGGEGDAEASVVVGAVLSPTSLDILHQPGAALDAVLLDNIYETLLTVEDDGTISPGLAALPEVSDDATVYTFTLEDGVTFHNGDGLTADDVVFSLDELRSETGTFAEDFATIDTVTAIDDLTVEVTLTQPDSELQFNLTRRGGAVVQADATELENSAVGTGPFSFVEWDVGASITIARNDAYWGDPAGVSEVTFQYFTDPNAAVNAFTTGDVDILTGVNSDLVGPLQDNSDYIVNQGTTNGEFTLGFNNERAPLDNRDVRQAIRQAIDKEGLLELYNGFGTIIGGPVPPADPWYEDLTDSAPYDTEAAEELLDGAGVTDGTALTLVYPNIYPTNAAEYIASQLAEVGIEVEIETVEFSVWLEQVFTNADYDMTVVLHVEPHDIDNYANPDYYWRYDSADVQQLIGDARTSTSPEESVELLKQAAAQIAADSPVDWLLLYADLTVSRPEVTGYPTNDTASRFDASGITVATG
ncbi:MAG: ABC transporter substrate-binding protein [Acidimicrobiia bacterium]|nr:ABC transporter substrate-binding protein [Acidimicrobiia bacterium]